MSSSDKPLSLCMIVKDETDVLRQCLESIHGHVSEIVVAWNGANPDTKAILDEFGCRVIPYVWKDDFSDARNFSFAQATNELCMWLDADDVVYHPERIPTILKSFDDPRIGSVWLPYDYDQDEYGHCAMLLYRERITRKSWWTWKGRIHETQQPTRDCAHVRFTVGDSDCVLIKHTVVKDRVQQSAARNLRIAQSAYNEEKENGDQDPRTIYDYARALNAGGNRKEALTVFEEFVQKSSFDDDRYEALRSMADIYRKFRWYESALNSEMEAVKIRPRRPEAYFGLAETYFCTDSWDEVIWFTEIGYRCPPREDNMPVDPVALKARPLMPLHFAFLQKGRFKEALTTVKKALEFFPRNQFLLDSRKTYEELIYREKLENAALDIYSHLSRDGESFKLPHLVNALPDSVMDHPVFVRLANKHRTQDDWQNRVVIYCGSSYEFWDPKCVGEGIGGSEEAVISLAPLLAKLGWQVEVYNNCLEEGNYDGALWKPFFTYDKTQKCAIFIAWRDSRSVLLAPEGSKVFAWMHDRQKPEYWSDEMVNRVDKVFFLSNYHRTDLPTLLEEKILITSNGIRSSQFEVPEPRDPKRCIYASSPDRGLDILLQNWPSVREKVPDAELHVFYGFNKTYDELHKNNQEMKQFKDNIMRMLQQPGVVYHGRVGHEQLAKEFLRSALWIYPTNFTEISCITAMKAQAAGAIPVTMTLAALNETVQFGYKISFSILDARTQKSFTQIVVDLLTHPEKQEKIRETMSDWAKKAFDWKNVASQWDSLFRKELTSHVSTPVNS